METKRVTVDFAERASIATSGETIKVVMNEIEANFKACNDILSSAGMNGINYEFQAQEISTVAEILPILTDYVVSAPQHVLSELDEPLTKDFQNNVIPALTDISVKDIKTQCSYSAENHSDLDGIDNMTNSMTDIMEIGFENFLTLASTVPPEDMQSLENVRAIQIFTNLFREEFESQMADGIRNPKGSLYYYLDDIPWGETFKSDSLNGTVTKPMVELIRGRDMITGEVLSEYEKRIRAQHAKVNLANISFAIAGGAAIGLGGIEIAAVAGLAALSSVGGKAANSATQKAVKELGGSDRLAELYGFRAEVIARGLGAKLIYDNYINPRIEVEMVGAAEVSETSWYKSDGSINYPPNNGAVPGTEVNMTLKPGETIGRYGNIGGKSNFVTQAGADASKLALPPNTDPAIYQEFEVIKDIPETIQSEIASWGGSEGGGLQYELPMPILQLIKEGYIVPK